MPLSAIGIDHQTACNWMGGAALLIAEAAYTGHMPGDERLEGHLEGLAEIEKACPRPSVMGCRAHALHTALTMFRNR